MHGTVVSMEETEPDFGVFTLKRKTYGVSVGRGTDWSSLVSGLLKAQPHWQRGDVDTWVRQLPGLLETPCVTLATSLMSPGAP